MNHLIKPTLDIDFNLLSKQKLELVTMTFYPDQFNLKAKQIDALDGIIHLLDAIQDYAVDQEGIDKKTVFPNQTTTVCPDCGGDPDIVSACCGASIDTDILICSDCKEHSEIAVCETCEGRGTV